jgi:hypothetical protein
MALEPGGIIAWLVVGLIAGWLTGKVMKGRGCWRLARLTVTTSTSQSTPSKVLSDSRSRRLIRRVHSTWIFTGRNTRNTRPWRPMAS